MDSIYLESREVFVVVADHMHYDICERRFLTIIKHVKLSSCVADNCRESKCCVYIV